MANGDNNPLTSVAIFCSMVEIMKAFVAIKNSDCLLWLQEKANITNRVTFYTLVKECETQFDVTWLWSKRERSGFFSRPMNTHTAKQLANTKLQ